MSRTYKDKPIKLKIDYNKDRIPYEYVASRYDWRTGEYLGDFVSVRHLKAPTTKPKKRKAVDTENHWMSTPGWWVRTKMNRPQRRQGSLWERKAVTTCVEGLDALDTPSVSRAPHLYYW